MEDKILNKKHIRSKNKNIRIEIIPTPKKNIKNEEKDAIPIKKIKLIKEVREEINQKLNELLTKNLNKLELYKELVKLTYQDNTNEKLIYNYIKLYYEINPNEIDNENIFKNYFYLYRYILSPNNQKELKIFEKYSVIFDPIKKISKYFTYIKNKKYKDLKVYIENEKKELNIYKEKNYPKFILDYNINNKHMFVSIIYFEFLNIHLKSLLHNIDFINIYEEDLNNIIQGNYEPIEIYYIFFMFYFYNQKRDIFLPAINKSEINFKNLNEINNFKFELDKNLLIMYIYNEKIFSYDIDKLSYYNINQNIINKNYFYLYYYYLHFNDCLEINYFFYNNDIKNVFYKNLKEFLQSKIMKDIYNKYKEEFNLNGQKVYFEYLFDYDQAFEELKENMFFLPFSPLNNVKKTAAITSREIMKIFVFSYPYLYDEDTNSDLDKLVEYLINYGYFNLCTYHESGGHYLFSYYYYIGDKKDNSSYLTPKNNKMYKELKKNSNLKNIEKYDRGDLLECILFGEKTEILYLFGAIYLLTDFYNEKNVEIIKNNFKKFNNSNIDIDEFKNLKLSETDLLKQIFKKFNTSLTEFLEALKKEENQKLIKSKITRNFSTQFIKVSLINDTLDLFTNENQGISPLFPPLS